MPVRLEVIGGQAHIASAVLQHKKNLAIDARSHVKVIHGFIPDRHFCAWHIAALGPSVRLALDKDRWALATEIKTVHFLHLAYAYGCRKVLHERNTLLGKKRARQRLKIVA